MILGFVIQCCTLYRSLPAYFFLCPFLPPYQRQLLGLICDLSQDFSWSWSWKKAKMLR